MKSILLALFLMLLSIPALANEPLNYEIDNLSVITGYSDITAQPAELDPFDHDNFANMAPEPDEVMSYSSNYPMIRENFEFLPELYLGNSVSYRSKNSNKPGYQYRALYLPNRDCNCRSSRRS